ncbi:MULTISPECIES: DNA-binding protein WhiA [Leucobacter]|uniref:Probable cell division protein WhiA n=1 Tax=Leucobacter iarius TaxID=333963 RepID=A0ABN2LL37_9MICO|nr:MULTISPECIES: DNA-binding protein WhiA [unclassified Leucobacter]PIJ32625.1 DNA-binding protein WhiA [Leucobacter sp. OLES1]PII81515.1 DNA-binding protein WhiA [Leucobacter sp. OLCALW19]PII86187.1 DNA-binding protein WhiA [Leucobacter sp. OLTLW20]PII90082.1 DNA-binding protein WhiA [Leucobacter sp. OLAS13]PII97115.1 DNA-binding protein WhiA [Leucobacter sp. OLDS2]
MPSTPDVKTELVRVVPQRTSERVSELATILRLSGGLHTISGRIALEAELHTPAIVQRVRKDLAEIYGVRSDAMQLPASSTRPGAPQFLVRVLDGETIARQLGLMDPRRRPIRGLPNRLTTGSQPELAAIWRGAFLARGSVTPPGRSASLEVVCPTNETTMALVGAAGRLGIAAKSRDIRGQHKVLVRDGEAIGEMLSAMGAVDARAAWDELRKARETRATANRLVNFDDANLRRSAQASVAACARVERALEILGDETPEHLRYAGALRLSHREASLDELGARADPPLTKDAIAGRIRRLLAMADKEAESRGIPGTEASLPEELDAL